MPQAKTMGNSHDRRAQILFTRLCYMGIRFLSPMAVKFLAKVPA